MKRPPSRSLKAESPSSALPMAKRPRGHPPESKKLSTASSTAKHSLGHPLKTESPSSASSAAKRPCGRPPKSKQLSTAWPTVKRPRGRPQKAKSPPRWTPAEAEGTLHGLEGVTAATRTTNCDYFSIGDDDSSDSMNWTS